MSVTMYVVPSTISPKVLRELLNSIVFSSTTTAHSQNSNEISNENNQIICTQYKTIFKDEKLLIKTLSEHGVSNINNINNIIHGEMGALKFEFEKDNEGVYVMNISHNKNENLDIVDDLTEEYQLNVQEQSYNTLKSKLESQNLKIDTEEILDDNSIMITVNLD